MFVPFLYGYHNYKRMMEITLAVITGVVIGLTTLAKRYIGKRYAPLASLVFGVLGVSAWQMAVTPQTVIIGLVIGLSASGLYSGSKSMLKRTEK